MQELPLPFRKKVALLVKKKITQENLQQIFEATIKLDVKMFQIKLSIIKYR